MAYTYKVFECLLRFWMGSWPHTHINNTTDASQDLWKLAKILHDASLQTMPLCFGQGCKIFQTASYVNVMSYIYEVFEHFLRMWIGIWLHTHTVTTKDVSPDLERLAEILHDASVQTSPLSFKWVCRTFQTASHVNVIYIWGVWATSQVLDGHMASHSHHYHHRRFPTFVRVGLNPTQCKCANHATMLRLRL